MFGFNRVKIEEQRDNLHINGVSHALLAADFKTLYNTTTMEKYMFKRDRWDTILTKPFFLVELHYAITKLLQLRNIRSSRNKLYLLKEQIETETWFKDTLNPIGKKFDFSILDKVFTFKPFSTQQDFLEQYPIIRDSFHLKGLLLDAKAGSGKTKCSLMWTTLLGKGQTMVLCPMTIVNTVWVTQIKEAFKETPRIWTSLSGLPLTPDYDFYIVHYDYMSGHADELKRVLKQGTQKTKEKFKLILDECHNFNDLKANRTQILIDMCDQGYFSDTLPMSGTPLKALGKEAYTAFCMIDPYFVGRARQEFLDAYGRARDRLNELLYHRLGRSKFTIKSLDGMADAPPIEKISVTFPNAHEYTLTAIQLRMQRYITDRVMFYRKNMPEFINFYHEIIEDYRQSILDNPTALEELVRYQRIVKRFRAHGFNSFTDIDDSKYCKYVESKIESRLRGKELADFRNIKSAVKYLSLKLRGEALGNVLGKARMEAVKLIIEHADLPGLIDSVEKKTLIFTSYIEVLKECENYLQQNGYKTVSIYGETNKDRTSIVDRFEKDPALNPCIALFDSLKEGQPMLMANQTILLNAPYRDYELTQVVARTWRKGQDKPCFFWLIDLDTGSELNITSRTIDIMNWSKEQVDQLLSKQEGNLIFKDIDVDGMESMTLMEEPEAYGLTRNMSVLSLF